MSENTVVLDPVQMNAELEKAIAAQLDPANIRAVILAEAEKQATEKQTADAQAVATKAAEDKAAADAKAAEAAPSFTRTEIINGRTFNFEGASELDLATQIANAYRVASAFAPTEQVAATVDPAVAEAAAQKDIADRAAAKALLDVKFRNGDISAADYIKQSGAMDEYLADQGLSLPALKAAVDQNQSSQFEKSWAQATEEFLHSPAGADWPGGPQNLELIGMKISSLGLVDAKDKVAALAQAYADMKSKNLVFRPEVAAATVAVTDPAVVAAQAAAAAAQAARAAAVAATTTPVPARTASSGLFGLSSGPGAATETGRTAETVAIDPKASPQEIMDAWKKSQLANGINPDAAFMTQFSNRRA